MARQAVGIHVFCLVCMVHVRLCMFVFAGPAMELGDSAAWCCAHQLAARLLVVQVVRLRKQAEIQNRQVFSNSGMVLHRG